MEYAKHFDAYPSIIVESIPNMDGCSKKVCSPEVVAVSVLVRRRSIICRDTWKNASSPESVRSG